MANPSTSPMTARQFVQWSAQADRVERRFELEQGEIVETPPPGELHGVVCWLIARIIGNYLFERGTGYLCTNDTGLLVSENPDTVRAPDLMLFLARKSLDGMGSGFVEAVPELVVEVFSPSDRIGKLNSRVKQYHDRGIPLVWVVFPEDRTVNVYRPGEFPKVLDETERLDGNGVLPDFGCDVAELFRLPSGTAPANSP